MNMVEHRLHKISPKSSYFVYTWWFQARWQDMPVIGDHHPVSAISLSASEKPSSRPILALMDRVTNGVTNASGSSLNLATLTHGKQLHLTMSHAQNPPKTRPSTPWGARRFPSGGAGRLTARDTSWDPWDRSALVIFLTNLVVTIGNYETL